MYVDTYVTGECIYNCPCDVKDANIKLTYYIGESIDMHCAIY